MKKIFIFPLISILIYGCVPSITNPTVVDYEIYSIITITNSNSEIYYNTLLGNDYANLYIPSGSNSVTYQGDATNIQTSASYQLPYSLSLSVSGNAYDTVGCANILVETFVNGILDDTQNIQMGILSTSPFEYCDNNIPLTWSKTLYIDLK